MLTTRLVDRRQARGSSRRLRWVDIAKGIAILCVIAGHTVPNGPLRSAIFSFHLPVFFVLSGFTGSLRPVREIAASLTRRLLVPYALLVLGQDVLVLGFIQGEALSPSDIAEQLFWSSGVTISGEPPVRGAWFLICMFESRIVFTAIQRVLMMHEVPLLVQGAGWFAGAWGMSLMHGAGLRLPLSLDIVPYAAFLMWCGFAAAKSDAILEKLRGPGSLLLVVIIWAIGVKGSDFEMALRTCSPFFPATMTALAGTLMVSVVSMILDRRFGKLVRPLVWCGRNSMTVYEAHILDGVVPLVGIGSLLGFSNLRSGWVALVFLRIAIDLVIAEFFLAVCRRLRAFKKGNNKFSK